MDAVNEGACSIFFFSFLQERVDGVRRVDRPSEIEYFYDKEDWYDSLGMNFGKLHVLL